MCKWLVLWYDTTSLIALFHNDLVVYAMFSCIFRKHSVETLQVKMENTILHQAIIIFFVKNRNAQLKASASLIIKNFVL